MGLQGGKRKSLAKFHERAIAISQVCCLYPVACLVTARGLFLPLSLGRRTGLFALIFYQLQASGCCPAQSI
jgi:hypothetical protein